METTNEETHDEANQTAEVSAPAAAPAEAAAAPEKVLKSHDPTCESCDKPAEKAETPVTSSSPFRRGFCADHKKDSPKRSVEHWARAKEMLPRMLEQGAVTVSGKLRAAVQNPKHADFHRARAFKGWKPNEEITEAEFDAAVDESASPTFR